MVKVTCKQPSIYYKLMLLDQNRVQSPLYERIENCGVDLSDVRLIGLVYNNCLNILFQQTLCNINSKSMWSRQHCHIRQCMNVKVTNYCIGTCHVDVAS